MRLTELLKGLNISRPPRDVEVEDITSNSKEVREGSLFVAIKGERFDGHDFIEEAIRRGAVAFVIQNPEHAMKLKDRPVIIVDDSRKALALLSSNFYGRISEKIPVIGITGTNGKTTTAFLIKSILNEAGIKTGLIGTIHYEIGDEILPALHTTPDAIGFQGLLKRMYDKGCRAVVAEVSSHALALKRVDGTIFERAVFTNLTRDHLDFHKDMDSYFLAKKRLFKELLKDDGISIINQDDEYGRLLKADLKNTLTYGIISGNIRAININNTLHGLRFDVVMEGVKEGRRSSYSVESALTGMFNVYNILAAFATGLSLDIPVSAIVEGIKSLRSVKGRFQRIDMGQDFLVVVDYAHTPDALERLILTAREILAARDVGGRIITVFGAGGDRDRGKRPLMGEIATRLSDLVVITNDNPRSEDPSSIIADILRGVRGENYRVIPDRFEAIREAIRMAEKGDIVLIAGKGHEEYQEIKGERFHFSDQESAALAIKERMGAHASP